MQRYVAYYRVSTREQGRSGLGIDAQKEAVNAFVATRGGTLVRSFQEVESGRKSDRPILKAAIAEAHLTGAILLIAKLDRLSRNAAFLLTLRDSGVKFVAADMPDANDLTVGILAVVAQEEARMISERTKAALQAAKARGVKLGCPNGAAHLRQYGNAAAVEGRQRQAEAFAQRVLPVIQALRAEGVTSLSGLSRALNERGIQTLQGRQWHPTTVKNLIQRAAA